MTGKPVKVHCLLLWFVEFVVECFCDLFWCHKKALCSHQPWVVGAKWERTSKIRFVGNVGASTILERYNDLYRHKGNLNVSCSCHRVWLTSKDELLVNILVIHQVNIAVIFSPGWQICTHWFKSRLWYHKSILF